MEEPDSLLGRAWHGVDEVALSWVTDAQWTLDGATWPAAVEVVHDPGAGGWATGWLYTDAGETPIAVCWNADGDDVWIQGEGLPEIGVEADCPVAPLN